MTFQTGKSPGISVDMGAGEGGGVGWGDIKHMIQRADHEFAIVLSLITDITDTSNICQ